MNLLQHPWMPVRRRDGLRDWVAPEMLSDPDIVAFDADRADFNGALMQFAIGLFQSVSPADTPPAWKRLFRQPPDFATLSAWFDPVLSAFEFDGEGARFMQDFSLKPEEAGLNSISALLIESPGENALRNNSDHFVKRGRVECLCPDCAALALFTLQTNAPAGGVGYRTGLRGGGPLTTLLLSGTPQSLWQDLWLNVQPRAQHLESCGDAGLNLLHHRFPWLADITVTQPGQETVPVQVHPDHIFWATPRRIRLNLDGLMSGKCDICGRTSDRLIRQFYAKNYGLNYKGAWLHPLSPYYSNKGDWLPMHPQPGGIGYRHWLGWVLGVSDGKEQLRPARTVVSALDGTRSRQVGPSLRLWAFGYDMDSMKARCWYESSLPLYGLADCNQDALRTLTVSAGGWLAGARLAVQALRNAVKDAWFGGDARGDFSAVDISFWGATERAFFFQLHDCIEALRLDPLAEPDTLELRQRWQAQLQHAAYQLFDQQFVGAGPVERQHPRRVAEARRRLGYALNDEKLLTALRLPLPEKTARSRGRAMSAQS